MRNALHTGMAYQGQNNYNRPLEEPIDGPVIGEFKGYPTLKIPYGAKNQPLSFGIAKAKAILKYYDDIVAFVAANDKE